MSLGADAIREQLRLGFFDEASEALAQIESGLLALEDSNDRSGVINDVFRAAHSIKGGAATFGLAAVAELAHSAETLLDALRAGALESNAAIVSTLLASVDALRDLVRVARDGVAADDEVAAELKAKLAELVSGASGATAPKIQAEAQPAQAAHSRRFRIALTPEPHMLERGNDALLMLAELDRLGRAQVRADLSRLPRLPDLDPTRCHLGFDIELEGTATRAQIEEIFAWVEGDAAVTITELDGAPSPRAAGNEPKERRADGPERDAAATSIRVDVTKLDLLMNMVGELVITQSMLGELDGEHTIDAARIARLREGLSQLARNTRALQESVMSLRSMPIGMVFSRLPRLVHDLSARLGKRVDLQLSGQTTEIDKTVLEKVSDPLVHLVRNSLDHGLETPEERLATGKPEHGKLEIRAFHRGGDIIVEVEDDGRGLDLAKIRRKAIERGLLGPDEVISDERARELIFAPGFSTADGVSDVSGRGVGMDVVRSNVKALGGDLQVSSAVGRGTRVSLRLPLTLAIIDGQLVEAGGEIYVIPLLSILESVQIERSRVSRLEGRRDLYRLRDHLVPMVDLLSLFAMPSTSRRQGLMVVVESEAGPLGLLVDDLLAQQQVVIKSLETNYGHVPGLAGATILGDGHVAFIVDVAGITRLLTEHGPSFDRAHSTFARA